jgi:1-aminocyclopropane-1-carboxylate synthase
LTLLTWQQSLHLILLSVL